MSIPKRRERAVQDLREVRLSRHYTRHAEGSVLAEFGDTKVLCTASVIDGVPRFLKGTGNGWITAEYGMLPRATDQRTDREAARGKQTGRTLEIQRLIGRSLRSAVDMKALGEYTITLDCDVIQADGGTRTAAITGAMLALVDALYHIKRKKNISTALVKYLVAAVSVGICDGEIRLDLDYLEDSNADIDLNVVMNEHAEIIEIQGTGEKTTFSTIELNDMLTLAQSGIMQLIELQKEILG